VAGGNHSLSPINRKNQVEIELSVRVGHRAAIYIAPGDSR
jgi:hypothetical protein